MAMKQIIPFILIAGIVAAAVFFLRDDYEETFQPDHRSEASDSYWTAILYANEDGEEYEAGIRLEHNEETIIPEEIEAVEVYVDSSNFSIYYEESDMDDFEGTIDYSEGCGRCSGLAQLDARVFVSWQTAEESRSSQYQLSLMLNE
ncbi:MAG: hypothetical protein EA344_13050 [Alkalicoccus sp.]|nr:MAG: hypothetical protein EA344_13050 [Alkalicoccus sp.]